MTRGLGIGPVLFALSVAGLAALSLVYGSFAPLVDPYPASLRGMTLWAYGPGALLLAACAGLFFPRTAPAAAAIVVVFNGLWVAVRLPAVVHEPLAVGSWYGVAEAAGPLVAAWVLHTRLRGRPGGSVTRILFGACCLVYGAAHVAYAGYTASMVPAWLPGRLGLAYLTGGFHAAAGLGLLFGILPRLAAALEALMIGLFGLLVWLPSFFAHPAPAWASSAQTRWSEALLTFLLAGSASIVADSLKGHPPGVRPKGPGG